MVISVIGIIYSVLFRLCCGSTGLLVVVSMMFISSGAFQNLEGMSEMEMLLTPQVQAFNLINGFALLIFGFAMLAGAIGLIGLKPWSRSLSLAAAGGEISWAIIAFGINVFFIIPSTNQSMSQMMGEDYSSGSEMVVNIIGAVMGTLVIFVFPVAMLIVLNLKSTRDQFDVPVDMRQSF